MSAADSARPLGRKRRWALAFWLVFLASLTAGLVALGALRKADHYWHDAVTPLLAAVAMSVSSLTVILNALRLGKAGREDLTSKGAA